MAFAAIVKQNKYVSEKFPKYLSNLNKKLLSLKEKQKKHESKVNKPTAVKNNLFVNFFPVILQMERKLNNL